MSAMRIAAVLRLPSSEILRARNRQEMLKTVLTVAKQCGYEQAELEVVSTNTPAIRLYESLRFEIWGTQPHSVRYRDGSYADDHFMVKRLV